MKSQFLSSLIVEQVTEDDWRLVQPLRYYSVLLDREIVIPAGFVTDFASVPRLPFIYWFTGGKANAPAVLHDWYYRTNTEDITRTCADALLAEAMDARGYWLARTWMMWAGVRIGGWWSYEARQAVVVSPAVVPVEGPVSNALDLSSPPPEPEHPGGP